VIKHTAPIAIQDFTLTMVYAKYVPLKLDAFLAWKTKLLLALEFRPCRWINISVMVAVPIS